MAVHLAPVKPTVVIYCQSVSGVTPDADRRLREVKAGLEEEGIPCSVKTSPESDVVRLAFQGTQDSPLGVGVGIGGQHGICIHYTRLPVDQPLFLLTEAAQAGEWRRFGYNAARLVKGTPLKNCEVDADAAGMESDGQRFDTPVQSDDLAALQATIAAIVQKILREPSFAEAMRRW